MSKVTVKNYEMKEFVIIQNALFQNKKISLKAKGLLGYMLSLPSDWDYTIEGLTKSLLEGKASIQSTLNELENEGYLERIRAREKGQFKVDYVIHSRPKKVTKIESPQPKIGHGKNDLTATDLPQPKIGRGSSLYTKKELQSTKKERVIGQTLTPSLNDILELSTKLNIDKNIGDKFYRYYTINGWRQALIDNLEDALMLWNAREFKNQSQTTLKNTKAHPDWVNDYLKELETMEAN